MATAFRSGDKVYYPVHGVAEVLALEHQDVGGLRSEVYVLRVLESGMRILVPVANAPAVGLRALLTPSEIGEVYDVLETGEAVGDTQTWNRRYREYMEKIKTGSAFEIAEVLKDLEMLRATKELSFGERRILEQARGLLAKEIAVAKGISEAEAAGEIDAFFADRAA